VRLEEAEESLYMMPTDRASFAPAGDLPPERELGELPSAESVLLSGGPEVFGLQGLDLFEREGRNGCHSSPSKSCPSPACWCVGGGLLYRQKRKGEDA
jgi:hypothetical protein